MSRKEFDDFIEEKTKSTQQGNAIDWEKKKQEWLQHLQQFYDQVDAFLKPYTELKKISVRYDSKRVIEEFIGEYDAKTALILIGSSSVRLDPVGTNMIGAKGRVDMKGPSGFIRFVVVPRSVSAPKILGKPSSVVRPQPEDEEWCWKIATNPPRIQYLDFNEESFLDALMEVANG